MTWFENSFSLLCKGGPVMVPLMACSVISVAVMFERYLRLKHARKDSADLMARVENCLALGKYSEAERLCARHGTPLGEMLASGLACSHEHAEKCMEEHALNAMPKLFARLGILDTIITIAPLLGLLGTVTGMIRAFHVFSATTALGSPMAITGGVAEALIATATGLAIAIITLVGYNYLTEQAKNAVSELELYGTRLANILSAVPEEKHEAKALGA
ncbi:MAG: MotA/TolQ/ExbB proton channel family protein [Armatimonadota bacterium]